MCIETLNSVIGMIDNTLMSTGVRVFIEGETTQAQTMRDFQTFLVLKSLKSQLLVAIDSAQNQAENALNAGE
jgi:hypothetical protein